ncbi:MAG: glycosyltransferase family 4 protein [Granulosicoccus sp.]
MSHQKLFFIYPGELDTRTGGYRYDKRIIEALRSGTKSAQPWHVTLVSLEGSYPFPTSAQLATAAAQLEAIDDHSLVVMDGLAYSTMPDVIAAHSSRLTIIALIHHPLALETGLDSEQASQLKALETRALHFARHIITTSELTADSLAAYNVPAHKVTAVLPGTDNAAIAQGSGSNVANLLCVATLTQRKGHSVLLDALATIPHLPWHLNCVGSTERDISHYKAVLEQRTRLMLDERVSFTGELEDEQLDQYYGEADVFVLASFHEGYGMVLSEAIARGLPIVCTNAGAMSQTVPVGAGILVPPDAHEALAEAISQILTSEQLMEDLKRTATSARENLRSWQTAANEFSELLTMTQR